MTQLTTCNVLIVDDHAVLRESLAFRLDDESDFSVIGQAPNADEALEAAGQAAPDVVLMDIDMPGMSCFDAVDRLRRARPMLKIIFLSAHWKDSFIEQAMNVAADGMLSKSEPPDHVVNAIRSVCRGENIVSSEISDRLSQRRRSEEPTTLLRTLTPRELQVLRYVAQGLSRKAIGQTMHISDNTVAVHTGKIMKKLGIHDRVELARFAIREGLAPL